MKPSTWATLFIYREKSVTFTTLVLHGLSRSHRLHKHISAETKLPLPKPYRPMTTNPSYFYSAASVQLPCLQNEVENKFLDKIF